MAKNTATTEPERSDPITVEGKEAKALFAAWRGIHEFFGGRVEDWELVTPTPKNPDGGIRAVNFTVNPKYAQPEQIIRDLGDKDRRVDAFPNLFYLQGEDPLPFTTPQEMSNFAALYLKNNVEDGTAKSPAYVREGIADYKNSRNMRTRRGRRATIIRINELGKINAQDLADVPAAELERLMALAGQVIQNQSNASNSNATEPATS